MIFWSKSTVLTNDITEEHDKGNGARNAADKKQTPETLQGEMIFINFIALRRAICMCQPFVVDFLEITIF